MIAAGEKDIGAALELSDLTIGYDAHPVVHHLSGEFKTGSLTAIVGPNGAGKSSLLKAFVGILKPIGGSIAWRNCPPHSIAYLPQAAEIDRSFPVSVFDFVGFGLWKQVGAFGAVDRAGRARIAHAITSVGLSGFERRPIAKLSGGQLQRVLFARALLHDAGLILLDEPFTAIDTATTEELIRIIGRWHGEKRTVIAVLHDLDLVRRNFPQTLLLAREPVAWGETAAVLSAANLLRARTMIEAPDPAAAPCSRAA
jgi:zinc/manganese transport system ATP-binding protein